MKNQEKDASKKAELSTTIGSGTAKLMSTDSADANIPTLNATSNLTKIPYRIACSFEDPSRIKSAPNPDFGHAAVSKTKFLVPPDQCFHKVLLTNLPSIEPDHLKLQLEKATKLQCGDEFQLEQRDGTSAIITFKRSLLPEGT